MEAILTMLRQYGRVTPRVDRAEVVVYLYCILSGISLFVIIPYMGFCLYTTSEKLIALRQEFKVATSHANADRDAAKSQVRELTSVVRGLREDAARVLGAMSKGRK
jgi:hypothetical protein